MKKITLVLVALLLVSGAAFAEITVGGDATISGSVSTTLGMDIESEVWGADADTSFNIKIPFANGTATTGGDDEIYGEISFKDVGVNWQEDDYDVDYDDTDKDNPGFTDNDYDGTDFYSSVSAKIVAGDIFIALNGGGYNFNNADGTDTYDVNLDDDWYDPSRGELTFGYDNGTVKASLLVGAKSGLKRYDAGEANEDYQGPFDGDNAEVDATTSTQAKDNNGVIFALMGGYTSDVFSMPVTVVMDPFYKGQGFAYSVNPTVTDAKIAEGAIASGASNDFVITKRDVVSDKDGFLLGASISPSINIGMFKVSLPVDLVFASMKDYSLNYYYIMDGVSNIMKESNEKGSVFGLDFAPSFNFTVMEGFDINLNGYIWTSNSVTKEVDKDEVKSDLTYYGVGLDFTLDNLVKGLVAEINFDLDDMRTQSDPPEGSKMHVGWGVDTSIAYTVVDGFTVTVEPDVDGDLNKKDEATGEYESFFESFDFGASLEFGPALTGIDNTTIKLAYSNLKLVGDNKLIEEEEDKGMITLATTISF